jgi:biotin synthase-related radical SAM superfamily protein
MDKETVQGDTAHAYDGAEIGMSAPLRGHEHRKARAEHYRCRAEELRTVAEDAILAETQRTLLSLADSYEHMASLLDEVSMLP